MSKFVQKRSLTNSYEEISYSQEGEDRILEVLLNFKPLGFYVDIGAGHPFRFSNTFLFYKRGWRGVNIDPNPDMIALFHKYRPYDKSICLGIGAKEGYSTYYCFEEPYFNTFDKKVYESHLSNGNKFIGCKEVKVSTLFKLNEEWKFPRRGIDFLSIDVEGMEYDVLSTNDWSVFRPMIILAEIWGKEVLNVVKHPAFMLLEEQGYKFVARTPRTCFFIDSTRETLNSGQNFIQIK